MAVSWKTDGAKVGRRNYHLLVNRVQSARRGSRDGERTAFDRWINEEIIALASAIKFSKEVHDRKKVSLVRQAITEACKEGPLNPENLLKAVENLQRDFLRNKKANFLVSTSASFKYIDVVRDRRLYGNRIRFYRFPPEKLQTKKFLDDACDAGVRETPENYCRMVVAVKARDVAGAVEEATRSINLLRGIWNFSLNWNRLRMVAGRSILVHQIILGPVHTVHYADGRPAKTQYWYEPNFPHLPVSPADLEFDWKRFRKGEVDIRRKISRNVFVSIHGLFTDYATALDPSDHFSAYLRLWRLLERLTNTGIDDSYNVTIRRASFLAKNREDVEETLNFLRDQRNRFSHIGEEASEIWTLVNCLRRFVEHLLMFYLNNPFKFQKPVEFSEFFDLPRSKDALTARLIATRRAIRLFK